MSQKELDDSYLVEVKRKDVVVKRRYSDKEKALDMVLRMPEEDNLSIASVDTGRTLLVERGTPKREPVHEFSSVLGERVRPRRIGRAFLLAAVLAVMLVVPLGVLLFTGGKIVRNEGYRSPVASPRIKITAERYRVVVAPETTGASEGIVAAVEKEALPHEDTASEMKPAKVITPVPGGISAILDGASLEEEAVSHPFTVHAGSFKKKERAMMHVSRLREEGEHAFATYVEIAGMGRWYRVFVGSCRNQEEAQACKARVDGLKMGESFVVKKPVAIAVGDPLARDSALSLERALYEKGFSAYTLPELRDDEKIQVMVGAFQKEGRAREMVAQLEKEGFSSTLVQR